MTDEEQQGPLALLRSGARIGEITEAQREEADRLGGLERRLRSRMRSEGLVEVDVAAFAKLAGLTVAEALSKPSEPRPVYVDDRRAMALASSRVPEKFARVILARAERETDPVRVVREWLAGTQWALVLGGDKGTGKTQAACLGIALGGGGLFVTAEEIVSPAGGNELAAAAKAAKPILVLDDMGDETLTEVGKARLLSVVGERYARGFRVIMTSNANRRQKRDARGELLDRHEPEQWAERYGVRLDDRLNDNGRFYGCVGPSLRGAL